MKQEELFSYIYDFLSQLLENKEICSNVNQIILFGSVARGDFHNKSDIDLFVDTKQPKKINHLIKREINKFEIRAEKTWFLRGINLTIKAIVGNLNQPQWRELREEILSYSKVLFGPYEKAPEQGKPALLITYELKSIPQKSKMVLLRKLYGYKSWKKNKEYVQKGLLLELGGRKIEANVILINRENWPQIKSLFLKLKVKYTLQEIWGK